MRAGDTGPAFEFVLASGEPSGKRMGQITATQGHMTMLPAGKCYRFRCDGVGVVLLQTIEGPDTIYRWAEICQTD